MIEANRTKFKLQLQTLGSLALQTPDNPSTRVKPGLQEHWNVPFKLVQMCEHRWPPVTHSSTSEIGIIKHELK